jgi:1-acyl-sn-glycerol-3-phosphate acyltransferase
MWVFMVVFGIVTLLGLSAVLMVLIYPVSVKARLAFANLLIKRFIPAVFNVFKVYVGFKIIRHPDNKDKLPGQFMIIANHQSLLDIPAVLYFFPDKALRFVAKEELGRAPLISQVMRAQKHAIIPRTGQTSKVMKLLDDFGGRVVERGQIPVLFPEGTRSRNGLLGEFYAAGFRRLLDRHPMPVAACAVDGGYRIATLDGVFRNLRNGFYHIKILKIFPAPQCKQEHVQILEESKTLIQNQLEQWRGK